MSPDSIVSIVAAVAAAGFGAWGARSARRTKRDHRRDDFTTVTDRMEKEIGRQGRQIAELKTEAAIQQDTITGQGAAISWLVVDRRSLVGVIRGAMLKTPPARPIPERARPYLDSIEL